MAALHDEEVLVLDAQTTSSSPTTGHLIELGWARVAGDDPVTVACQPIGIPEDVGLPRAVRRVTGISREDLEGAPDEEAAWRALRRASGDPAAPQPTVIHFARFELSFLRPLQRRLEPGQDFPFEVVCTHQIACRLHPDLPRRNLRAMAGYYGFNPDLLRRSEGHVRATAHVWRRMSVELAAREGITAWPELRRWLADTNPQPRRPRTRGYPMLRAQRLALPDRPGVYRFRREGEGLLYIGKAKSLRKRVNSYFTKRRGHDERLLEMLSQAKVIDATETHTALEAAVLETDEIKAHRPPYNKALRHEVREVWFARPDLSEMARTPNEAFSVGPLPSRWSLRSFQSLCALLDRDDLTSSSRDDRNRAMGAGAQAWWEGPQDDEFNAGLALFFRRHETITSSPVRGPLLRLSRKLAALDRRGRLDRGPRNVPPGPRPWDPERVARHLERVTLQMGQQLRRARWLTLLSESVVAWHEPGQTARRQIIVAGGRVVSKSFVPPERPLPAPPGAALAPGARRLNFIDIHTYDRLRVLSTELKRLCRDCDDVAVRISLGRPYEGPRLRRLLEAG
ncbi:MAG: GIY-YIG nuclease family protein [Myxococcota bacterium]